MIEHNPFLKQIICSALEEDLGFGDLTTNAVIAPEEKGRAFLFAGEELVLAGLPVFREVFLQLCAEIEFEEYFAEGELVPEGRRVCLLKGPLSPILSGERTALNFIQRMSGIATLTRLYVEEVGRLVKIVDTRKTAPGLRWFDKYAVRKGGGHNHRFGLYDGILVKDNHIAAAGSVERAVELAKKAVPHTLKVEVEVEDQDGVMTAMHAGADAILLDNMTVDQLRDAVNLVKGSVILEASGGITLNSVKEIAETGVDLISVGALTHSAHAVDFSLEIVSESES